MRHSELTALVMHIRPYRETSAMVQFFSREQGRIVGVMKGVRRGRNPVAVQPFCYGRLTCSGRDGLMTVTQFEVLGRYTLTGDGLSAGFYVLELLSRVLAERQVEPRIFLAAEQVLATLQALSAPDNANLAKGLRAFETTMLSELGYGFDYDYDATTGAPINTQGLYKWEAEHGFCAAVASDDKKFEGWMLKALSEYDYSDPTVLRLAKQLNQEALKPLLGSAPLISRAMYKGQQGRTDRG